MNVQKSLTELESPTFAAKLELANDLRMFFEALREEFCIRNLVKQASADASVAETMLHRIGALLKTSVDVRYRNPYDAAIAAYVWILAETYPSLARLAANAVVGTGKLWWAAKVAALAIEERLPKIRKIYEHRRSVSFSGPPSVQVQSPERSVLLTSLGASAEMLRDESILLPSAVKVNAGQTHSVINEVALPHTIGIKPTESQHVTVDQAIFGGKAK